MDEKISIYNGINPEPIGTLEVLEALHRIRHGVSRELVERIRQTADKEARNELKKQLPAITFAGQFNHRDNKSLLQSSGLAILDFDHVDSPVNFRDHVYNDNDFILAAWISPSGDGVKTLAMIPKVESDKEYKQYYEALTQELETVSTDQGTKDIARLCFESFDPDIKIRDFDKVSIFDKKVSRQDTPATGKVNDKQFNPILAKLAGRGLVYTETNRNNFIHAFACETNRAGIPEGQVINFALSTFKELDKHETTAIIKGVYERNEGEFNNEYSDLQAMAEATRINVNTPRPNEPYILSIDGQPVASLGSFTLTTGKAKARKTHHNTQQAAAFLRGIAGNHTATLPEDKDIVIYFDTEQSGGEAWDAANKIIKTAGSTTADRLQYHSLRPYTPEQRVNFINYKITTTAGVGVVFIDGIRDLVNDINNPTEATQAATALLRWTGEYHIHIFCTLHLNKSDGNARGHLGTELVNKAQTIINIEKAADEMPYSVVSFIDGRGRGFNDYALGYDSEGQPVNVNIEDVRPAKPGKTPLTADSIPINEHCKKLEKVIPSAGLQYKELVDTIQEGYNIGMNKAKDFIKHFQETDLIYKANGHYKYRSPHQAKDFERDEILTAQINEKAPY